MLSTPLKLLAVSALMAGSVFRIAWAREGATINIPMRSKLTPVQRLNREGVEAGKEARFCESRIAVLQGLSLRSFRSFYALNNLGFISELQGQLDGAHKFYALASVARRPLDADIDLSNVRRLE